MLWGVFRFAILVFSQHFKRSGDCGGERPGDWRPPEHLHLLVLFGFALVQVLVCFGLIGLAGFGIT